MRLETTGMKQSHHSAISFLSSFHYHFSFGASVTRRFPVITHSSPHEDPFPRALTTQSRYAIALRDSKPIQCTD